MDEDKSLKPASKSDINDDVEMIKVHTPNFFERHFLHVLIIFGLGFLIFTYIFSIHFKPIYIVGTSMKPTINNSVSDTNIYDTTHSDLVYYQKHNNYSVGNIVLVDASGYLPKQNDPIIKRIIAANQSTIAFEFYEINKTVVTSQNIMVYNCYYNIYVDGKKLTEEYIKEQKCYLTIRTDLSGKCVDNQSYTFIYSIYNKLKVADPIFSDYYTLETGTFEYNLQPNEFFVCGDNRNNSTDSRYFGAIKKEDILGSVSLHVPYGTNLFVAIWKAIFN